MRKIDFGRGTENGAAKLAAVFGLFTKNHRGPFGAPIGARVNREALEAGARVTETFYSEPEAESGSSGISLTPQLRIPARDGFLGCFNKLFCLLQAWESHCLKVT